jgi:hypothetical protein
MAVRAPSADTEDETLSVAAGITRGAGDGREGSMKLRGAWSLVAIAPLIAAGCAAQSGYVRPGDRTFEREGQAPGSAVGQGTVVIPPPPQSVVVQPSQAPVVVSPGQTVVVPSPSGQSSVGQPGTVTVPASQIVQADGLQANEVRANTIYANRIEAPEIQGTIHQTGGVRMDPSVSDLKAQTVVASVLYADTIKADRVIANQIYVRDVDRR